MLIQIMNNSISTNNIPYKNKDEDNNPNKNVVTTISDND